MLVGFRVLRENRDAVAHHFLRDGAADGELFGKFLKALVTRFRSDLVEAVIGHSERRAVFVRKKRNDAVGRRAAKDKIGRFFKDLLKIKNGAERFAHLEEQIENLCLSPKVL